VGGGVQGRAAATEVRVVVALGHSLMNDNIWLFVIQRDGHLEEILNEVRVDSFFPPQFICFSSIPNKPLLGKNFDKETFVFL
jgi:hypothetical protein